MHLLTAAKKVLLQSSNREHTVLHRPHWLRTTNKNRNAHPCNTARGIHCWSVCDCVHMTECLCLLSLPLGWDWRLWQASRRSAGQIWSPSWRNPVSPEQRTNKLVLQDYRDLLWCHLWGFKEESPDCLILDTVRAKLDLLEILSLINVLMRTKVNKIAIHWTKFEK